MTWTRPSVTSNKMDKREWKSSTQPRDRPRERPRARGQIILRCRRCIFGLLPENIKILKYIIEKIFFIVSSFFYYILELSFYSFLEFLNFCILCFCDLR
jgi:hypothetical protein